MGGGGGGGGMSASEQRYYQEQSMAMQREQLELQKQSMAMQESANKIQAESVKLAKAGITEPEKKIDSVKKAASDTARAQELRRGLSSVFSRDSVGLASAGGSATGGQSAKLGG